MKGCLLVFLFVPSLLFSQKKVHAQYGFNLNNGFALIEPSRTNPEIKGLRAISYGLYAGIITQLDSNYLLQCGLRFGNEKSRLELSYQDNFYFYHYYNNVLSLLLAPGLKLSERHRVFLTLNLSRVFENHADGSGSRYSNNKVYNYQVGGNLLQTAWDFRPGLKWEYKLFPAKQTALIVGIEPSFIARKVALRIPNSNPNLSDQFYYANYQFVLLYAGFSF